MINLISAERVRGLRVYKEASEDYIPIEKIEKDSGQQAPGQLSRQRYCEL